MTTTPTSIHRVPPQRQASSRIDTRSVAVVGLGYVGLPTAISLSPTSGFVYGLEINQSRLERIKAGELDHTAEQQLRLEEALAENKLRLTSDARSLASADAVVICVPTPIDEHLVPDMAMLRAACANVVAHARRGQTIILTSTTYAGCTDDFLVQPLVQRGLVVGADVFVAFSPERINPGALHHTPETTPRVLGGVTDECARRAREVLSPTCAGFHTVSSPAAAEMAKLLENTFRAVNIAMVNEFADAARALDLSVNEVIDAAASKPYGFMRFDPGPGVGGHCIPCDPHYLLWQMRSQRRISPVIESAMSNIATRPMHVVTRVTEVLAARGSSIKGSRIHVWGVAYKPGVADAGESPALAILEELRRLGAILTYRDARIGQIEVAGEVMHSSPDADLDQQDLTLVITVHPEDDTTLLAGRTVLDTTYKLSVDGVENL